MLPADARLRRRQDFSAAVRRGPGTIRVGARSLVVHLWVPPSLAHSVSAQLGPMAGFVVSRAVGPAVVRNRVKRRLRHLVAERLSQLPAGCHLVVRALPPAAAAPSSALAQELDRSLERAVRALARSRVSTAEGPP